MTPPRAERGTQSPMLLQVHLDNQPFNYKRTNYPEGTNLQASVSETDFARYGGIYVFETPLVNFQRLEDYRAVLQGDGETTDLGDLPTLVCSEQRTLELTLKPNTLYDIFYPHGTDLDPVRITTGDTGMPRSLTFDESKFVLALQIGLKPADLKGVQAVILADQIQFIDEEQYQFRFFGFQVGDVVATLSRTNIWQHIFVDRHEAWKTVTPEDFAANIQELRDSE